MKGSGHTDIKSWLFVPSNAKIKCLSDILVVGVLIHSSLVLCLIGSGLLCAESACSPCGCVAGFLP